MLTSNVITEITHRKPFFYFLRARIATTNLFQVDLDKTWNNLRYRLYKRHLRPRCSLFERAGGRGGARGVPGGPLPPQILPAPPNFPRDVMPLHWSPTQTIDSSPCCKTGPSSGPPNENVWLRPWQGAMPSLSGVPEPLTDEVKCASCWWPETVGYKRMQRQC